MDCALLKAHSVELVFIEEEVEDHVHSRSFRKSKAIAKILGQQRGEKGILILKPGKF